MGSLVYVVNDLDRALQYVQVQQKYAHDVCGAMIDLCTNATLLDASVIQRMWNRIDLDTDVIDTSTWLINETVHHTDVVAGDAWDAALWENAAQAYFLVADAVAERGFRNLDEHVWVNRLILSNEYLVLMHRANEDTARRRLQSSGTSVSDLHASTDELVDAIYASLQLGESYGVTYDYYSMSVAKGWPTNNYLPASDVDWFVMNTSTAFSDEAIAYGMSSVKSGTGSSNCSDPALGCDIHSDTLSSSVYIVTARDLTASPDMELAILANNIDSIVIDPTPVSYSADCDGAPNVTFACNQDNETWGHPYVTETLTCAGYGSWYYTCPQYSITYECESNANCTVQESVTGALTCLCSVGYEASSPTAVLGSAINNFDTYVRSVVNSAVYSKRVVSPSSAEFNSFPTSVPTMAPSIPNENLDADNGRRTVAVFSMLLPVIIFCCCLLCLLFFCMKRIDYEDEWKKVNNSPFGIRDYVNQYRTDEDDEVDLDAIKLHVRKNKDGDPLRPTYDSALEMYEKNFQELTMGDADRSSHSSYSSSDTDSMRGAEVDPLSEVFSDALPHYAESYDNAEFVALHARDEKDEERGGELGRPLPSLKSMVDTLALSQASSRTPTDASSSVLSSRIADYNDGSEDEDEEEGFAMQHLKSPRKERLPAQKFDIPAKSGDFDLYFQPEDHFQI